MTPYLFHLMMWLTATPAAALDARLSAPAVHAHAPRAASPVVFHAAVAAAAAAPAPVVTAAPAVALKLTADAVIGKIQAVYESTTDFKATFTQIYSHKVYKREMRSEGVVYFKKPGLMRWEYTKPEEKYFVGDGKTLWVYEPLEATAYKSPMDAGSLPTSITFLMGKGDLRAEFDAALLAAHPLAKKGEFILELKPRKDGGHYKKLLMVVNPSTFLVEQTLVYDPTGNVNHIVFGKVERDKPLDPKLFTFTPPAGVEVVEIPK